MSILGSGAEQVEVVATHNVLGMRRGERAFLPVDTPELAECLALDFVRHVVDGEEIIPDQSARTLGQRCGSCGG